MAELKERARGLVARFKEAKQERENATQGVDPEAIALYDRVLKSKGDFALAELANDLCCGCNMRVVSSTVSKVKAGKELVRCENCSRILYEV